MTKFGKFVAPTAASALALLIAMPTAVQAAEAQAAAADVEEIVVTGTRIVRDGYEAPTPLTVIDSDALANMTTTSNIADSLRQMPVFSGGQTPTGGAGTPSSMNAGLNTFAVRSLGANKTLVLIDGHRVVQSLPDGTIDVNTFPQQLIARVDV